jgi:ABC-2 type transport system permease protein
MNLAKILIVARRDYLATVRRKAFVFTILGTPLLYTLLLFIVIKPQAAERVGSLKSFRTLGVVDSSGLFAQAPRATETELTSDADIFSSTKTPPKRERFHTDVRFYPDLEHVQQALRSGEANQVLVIPKDYLETGKLRRYARSNNLFSSTDERVLNRWLVRGMLAGNVDSLRAERAVRPLGGADLFTLNRQGNFELKDDRKELFDFMLPFAFGMLLGLSIVIGGQYLLQSVNEEKESRILESLLCTVSAEELLSGKLIGLGAAGLTIVASWVVMGVLVGGPALAMAQVHVQPLTFVVMAAYFVLGYLFIGSLMTGIGAVASSMREAQQFAVWFTFLTFIPFYLLPVLVGHPDSPLAIAISLFPPTAPVSMMLRMASPSASVPLWQIGLSLGLLGLCGWLALMAAARIFRIGMLMYGKTPTLPEILRWAGQK